MPTLTKQEPCLKTRTGISTYTASGILFGVHLKGTQRTPRQTAILFVLCIRRPLCAKEDNGIYRHFPPLKIGTAPTYNHILLFA